MSQIINMDCLDFMKALNDNSIDLCLTDPPYGLDFMKQRKNKTKKTHKSLNGWTIVDFKDWDTKRPEDEIFKQIFRVSKNQIIWGGNYFSNILPPSQCWLVWNKGQRNFSLADGELAYTSFNKALRIFDYARSTQRKDEERIHPTQKPVKLFEWCLKLAKLPTGATVLDPFSGSGTTAIACKNLNLKYICIEKDKDYYNSSVERVENARQQLKLKGL